MISDVNCPSIWYFTCVFLHLISPSMPAAIRRCGITDMHFSQYSQPPPEQGSSLLDSFCSITFSHEAPQIYTPATDRFWTCHLGSQFQRLHWHNHIVILLLPLSICYLDFSSLCMFLASFLFQSNQHFIWSMCYNKSPLHLHHSCTLQCLHFHPL